MQDAAMIRSAALRSVPMFADLHDPQMELLAQHAEEHDVSLGADLVREGEEGDRLILIMEGTARVERGGQAIAHLSTNQFVGEMALLDGKPRAATVTMESDGRILVINRATFRALLDSEPEFRDKLLSVLCDRLRGLQTPIREEARHPAQPIELDHLYAYGEVYDALDVCDQVTQALSRLKRHGILSNEDWHASEEHLDGVRLHLERLTEASGSAPAGR